MRKIKSIAFIFYSISRAGGTYNALRLMQYLNYLNYKSFGIDLSKIVSTSNKKVLYRILRFSEYRIPLFKYSRSISSLSPEIPDADCYIATFWPTAYLASKLSCERDVPSFYYIQHFEPIFYPNSYIYYLAERTYRLPLFQLTISRWLTTFVTKYSNKVMYVGYFLDPTFLRQSRREKCPRWIDDLKKKNFKIILGIYRPEWWKGSNLLSRALISLSKNRKDIIAVIIGEFQNSRLDFPHIKLGWVSRGELLKLYSCADVFVYTSYYEGFGLPPLEAMACGVPVVTTDNLGSRDFAVPGINALLVPRDPEAIAQAVTRVLSDEDLRESLVREGLRTAHRFSIEDAVRRFESALKEGCEEFYNFHHGCV